MWCGVILFESTVRRPYNWGIHKETGSTVINITRTVSERIFNCQKVLTLTLLSPESGTFLIGQKNPRKVTTAVVVKINFDMIRTPFAEAFYLSKVQMFAWWQLRYAQTRQHFSENSECLSMFVRINLMGRKNASGKKPTTAWGLLCMQYSNNLAQQSIYLSAKTKQGHHNLIITTFRKSLPWVPYRW